MTIQITLTDNDPRLGTFAENGAIERWPEQDVLGREDYNREHMTIHRMSGAKGGTFVVVPPDRGKDIEFVEAAKAATPDATDHEVVG